MNDSSEGIGQIDSSCSFTNPFHEESNVSSFDNPISQFLEAVPSSDDRSDGGTPEMFLPGLVIHILPKKRSFHMTLWKGWRVQERADSYQAFVVNRERFKDIIVSPSMFLDHLPWRYLMAFFYFSVLFFPIWKCINNWWSFTRSMGKVMDGSIITRQENIFDLLCQPLDVALLEFAMLSFDSAMFVIPSHYITLLGSFLKSSMGLL